MGYNIRFSKQLREYRRLKRVVLKSGFYKPSFIKRCELIESSPFYASAPDWGDFSVDYPRSMHRYMVWGNMVDKTVVIMQRALANGTYDPIFSFELFYEYLNGHKLK